MATRHLKTSEFESDVLTAGGVALIDFWASWCGPCRMLGPIIDEIASEAADNVLVGKINVDEEQTLAAKYGVMTIPTVILFKDGEEVERLIGVQPKQNFTNLLSKAGA